MSDDIKSKVISIFERHRREEHGHFQVAEGEEFAISPDGFHYATLKHEHAGPGEEKSLLEMASCKHYMFKMMETHPDSHTIRLNNYHVPGDRLEEFLLSLPGRPGTLLEIRQFIPDHMA